ncbi:hypothetical protein OP10G_2871 [Fimbriimonas ginsengisoli Gsoil 348]|uniref:Lipoprotein n=1 Tax=Fimbriimonas ginsengisoli Gsoil 348 TaxID=661478 RepID=A0A068NX85_FIMGI|nr:hypothetical protein OP10G_2871 [Fimbriimonas ginsengisoli Gsoil 348]
MMKMLKFVLLASLVLSVAACGSGSSGEAEWARNAKASHNRGENGEK